MEIQFQDKLEEKHAKRQFNKIWFNSKNNKKIFGKKLCYAFKRKFFFTYTAFSCGDRNEIIDSAFDWYFSDENKNHS